ncbi:MAG: hypothetical protein A2504_10670 [Bdellovibrionales bacterium RIFOXYD12_FULL_39_22]|nr:MAG: hypothetical protein A2385_14305 [Bdellovibrionales bacterium RIFOXYB1_FULL_39_21]OFZ40406.1 MAG: hypothetical protein A2485_02995 [Bdellovibrionales bacterium RIFOXYC12_FULL_39_17]OFZ49655.1 MAG: hypothetical protein A2404_09455 [Bdellovibrionales bacterium RIFOXYC1_FULL_39_130]OFZ77325.1 MAG: hypothetical protein A2560_06120 [Bdellovibrionales bacterium RIFOXYD1_FULL_39_84]OFZ95980.1 MAG: hypothetical protein A2504_10670 [Bdellovibrionales bacterium RIFOXYD12_FULL_39_22]HLE11241.1 hy
MFVVKFVLYFFVSYLILSIPIADTCLFNFMSTHTRQYTDNLYGIIQEKIDEGIVSSRRLGMKLFTNATPKGRLVFGPKLPAGYYHAQAEASAAESFEGRAKVESEARDVAAIEGQENYTVEEEELLKRLLKRPD